MGQQEDQPNRIILVFGLIVLKLIGLLNINFSEIQSSGAKSPENSEIWPEQIEGGLKWTWRS